MKYRGSLVLFSLFEDEIWPRLVSIMHLSQLLDFSARKCFVCDHASGRRQCGMIVRQKELKKVHVNPLTAA